jgi:hypothetical protein
LAQVADGVQPSPLGQVEPVSFLEIDSHPPGHPMSYKTSLFTDKLFFSQEFVE